MRFLVSQKFEKIFKRRFNNKPYLNERLQERIGLFAANPNNEILNNHRLKGYKKPLYSFSITGDIRVIYELIDENTAKLLDIGTHNQVY